MEPATASVSMSATPAALIFRWSIRPPDQIDGFADPRTPGDTVP
jgi:hypothetical protein